MRVQQIRNIGAIEGNAPVSTNEWEDIKKKGDKEIKKWIDDNMAHRSCVVVLIGSKTADRELVQYEIKKAWEEGKSLLGIYIHNIKCPRNGKDKKGKNPFEQFEYKGIQLSKIVKCYNPDPSDAYNDIAKNIEKWIEEAIEIRSKY
jgi:hypothetical protein